MLFSEEHKVSRLLDCDVLIIDVEGNKLFLNERVVDKNVVSA